MRSLEVVDAVYGFDDSHPDPIAGNLLSAFWIVVLRNFEERGVRGAVWSSVSPYGFGAVGVLHGRAGEKAAVRILSLGTAVESFGDVGKEGYCVRERLAEDATDEELVDDADVSDDRDEDLLRVREKTEDANDAREKIESVGDGKVAESGVIPVDGTWTSLRITTKDILIFFLDSRSETYSRAAVTSVGSLFASRSEDPASRG